MQFLRKDSQAEMNTYHIVVASHNPVKVEAVRRGFRQCFPSVALHIVAEAVSSGVSDQPMSDAETQRGARQRAQRAAEAHANADFWVGIEGGVQWEGDDLLSFAWIAIRHRSGAWGMARTGTFLLPPAVAALIRAGHELGDADDRVFGQFNSKQHMGAVGLLTQGKIERADLYEHAVVLALIPFGQAWAQAQQQGV